MQESLQQRSQTESSRGEKASTKQLLSQARFTSVLVKTVRKAPVSTVCQLLHRLQLDNAKQFHAVIKLLAGLSKKANIAAGFKL